MTEAIQAIDVHAHIGTYRGAKFDLINELMSGDASVVAKRAALARTKLTMVSPLEGLMPRLGGDPVVGNQLAAEAVQRWPELMHWVVVDPTPSQRRTGRPQKCSSSPRPLG